jgi:hypothetical protein
VCVSLALACDGVCIDKACIVLLSCTVTILFLCSRVISAVLTAVRILIAVSRYTICWTVVSVMLHKLWGLSRFLSIESNPERRPLCE